MIVMVVISRVNNVEAQNVDELVVETVTITTHASTLKARNTSSMFIIPILNINNKWNISDTPISETSMDFFGLGHHINLTKMNAIVELIF